MNTHAAAELIRHAITGHEGAWADLGAGSGTFTRALVEILGPAARVHAVDRDPAALAGLARWARKNAPGVTTQVADFTRPLDLPALDGMLLANALHFVADGSEALARLAAHVRPGGRVVIVEYDGRGPSRWVPYPMAAAQWPEMARAAGLTGAAVRARRASAFGGDLYVGTADRPRG
jgi:trans-aconitate methyltransferase